MMVKRLSSILIRFIFWRKPLNLFRHVSVIKHLNECKRTLLSFSAFCDLPIPVSLLCLTKCWYRCCPSNPNVLYSLKCLKQKSWFWWRHSGVETLQIKSNSVLQSLSLPWKFAVLEPERPGASLFSCVLLEDEPRALFKLKLSVLRVYKRVCYQSCHKQRSTQQSSQDEKKWMHKI